MLDMGIRLCYTYTMMNEIERKVLRDCQNMLAHLHLVYFAEMSDYDRHQVNQRIQMADQALENVN